MSAKTLYTAHAHTVGGREGAAKSSDGPLDVKLLNRAGRLLHDNASDCQGYGL